MKDIQLSIIQEEDTLKVLFISDRAKEIATKTFTKMSGEDYVFFRPHSEFKVIAWAEAHNLTVEKV